MIALVTLPLDFPDVETAGTGDAPPIVTRTTPQAVRTWRDHRGQLWFVAADVATALGGRSKRGKDVVRNLHQGEHALAGIRTTGGTQTMRVINSDGLRRTLVRRQRVHSEFLYVLEILGRGVKVGRSVDPHQRRYAHQLDAEAYGYRTGRLWTSPVAHSNARANELHLMGGSRREYLERPYEAVVAEAARLAFVQISTTALAQIECNRAHLVALMQGEGS